MIRLYLRLASLPAADVAELLSVDAAAGNDLRIGYRASGSRLTIRFGNAAVTAASSSVNAGTWYRLGLRLTADTNPRTADWQIDGVPQTSISSVGAASVVNTLRFGSTVNADAYTANYDDVVISATAGDYPLGAGSVVALRPNGMGTSVTPGSFLHEDGSAIDANTYIRLDDDPLSTATDYVRQATIGPGDYVELTLADTAAACIAGVSAIVAYHAAGTPVDNGKASIFDGATERIVFSGDMSQTALQYASVSVAPAAGSWTTSAVNALQARIGYSSDVTPNPYWDAVMLEVATGNSVPGTVTVTATAGGSTVTTTYTDVGSASPTLLSWSTDRLNRTPVVRLAGGVGVQQRTSGRCPDPTGALLRPQPKYHGWGPSGDVFLTGWADDSHRRCASPEGHHIHGLISPLGDLETGPGNRAPPHQGSKHR